MSTERRLRIYDHRLVRLVQETGDGRIATGMGVPRSTVAGWLKRAPRAITTEPGLDDASEIELRVRIAKLEKRVDRLSAVLRISFALFRLIQPDIKRLRVPHASDKARLLRAIDRSRHVLAPWREGLVNVRAGKSKHPRALPLPHDAGEALAIHLRGHLGSARGQQRAVFLRAVPPEGPMSAAAVSCVAARALRRAGIDVPHAGAHVFRRTAATWMVRRGATFKEVADVLGHARLETTAIYAKLDLGALLDVALPWPGGE